MDTEGRMSAPSRHRSIHTLLQHFPIVLENHALSLLELYEGFGTARDYWYRQLHSIAAEGVNRDGVRLCCDLNAVVTVGLRQDSAPGSYISKT